MPPRDASARDHALHGDAGRRARSAGRADSHGCRSRSRDRIGWARVRRAIGRAAVAAPPDRQLEPREVKSPSSARWQLSGARSTSASIWPVKMSSATGGFVPRPHTLASSTPRDFMDSSPPTHSHLCAPRPISMSSRHFMRPPVSQSWKPPRPDCRLSAHAWAMSATGRLRRGCCPDRR